MDPSNPTDEEFREALSHWASGVTVVGVRNPGDGRVYATTVTAFASASLDPPLVLVCLGAGAQVLPFLSEARAFGVSILSDTQGRTASVFADSFPVGPSPFGAGDPPVIVDALFSVHCVVHDIVETGDHRVVFGRVTAARPGPDGGPLIRYRRRYRGLKDT